MLAKLLFEYRVRHGGHWIAVHFLPVMLLLGVLGCASGRTGPSAAGNPRLAARDSGVTGDDGSLAVPSDAFDADGNVGSGAADGDTDPPPEQCEDGVQTGTEAGIDCGGPCLACPGASCTVNSACRSGQCGTDGYCQAECRKWGSFSEPVPVEAINDAQTNWGPETTVDGLTLLFCTEGALLMSTRTSVTAPFRAPAPVPGITSRNDLCDPTITGDGLELIYAEYSESSVLRTTTRASRNDAWRAPSTTEGLSADNFYCPWISKDGLRIYFADDSSGDGVLLMAARQSRDAPFGPVQPLFAAASRSDDCPSLSKDERLIVFESWLPDGATRTDLWTATRPSRSQPFDAPSLVDGVNSSNYEYDPGLSSNGSVLYFASDRASRGDVDIYVATRDCID